MRQAGREGGRNQEERGAEGRGDTQSGCSVDNQTLYCLSHIRRNTVKVPLGNKETADS